MSTVVWKNKSRCLKFFSRFSRQAEFALAKTPKTIGTNSASITLTPLVGPAHFNVEGRIAWTREVGATVRRVA